MKRKSIILLLTLLLAPAAFSQPNCNLYKWEGNTNCYKACKLFSEGIKYRQGSRKSQQYFDDALKLCPSFATAHMEKAVPYLKRGDFINWKIMIDEAVSYSPQEFLGYRAWCRYQFLRDYQGAIKDIEELETMTTGDIGYCQNGRYHLLIAKAICYKEIGAYKNAQKILYAKLNQKNYSPGVYDYLHLGVVELNLQLPEKAIKSFQKQISINDYPAENYFYLAKAYDQSGDQVQALAMMEKALNLYQKGDSFNDVYSHPSDKIYLEDIEKELLLLKEKIK